MFIKIYFNDKPLFLCDNVDELIEPYLHHDDAVFIDELDAHTVKTMIHEMQLEKVHAGVFFHKDLESLKKAVFKKFTVIRAAGGVVSNDKHQVMLIFRKGKWDLPKGKLDKGEKLEDCAIREVQEETGLVQVTLIEPLAVTYHTYHEGARFNLKESHWFTMSANGNQQLIPQKEEDIQEIIWVDREKLGQYEEKSYPNISDVLKQYMAY